MKNNNENKLVVSAKPAVAGKKPVKKVATVEIMKEWINLNAVIETRGEIKLVSYPVLFKAFVEKFGAYASKELFQRVYRPLEKEAKRGLVRFRFFGSFSKKEKGVIQKVTATGRVESGLFHERLIKAQTVRKTELDKLSTIGEFAEFDKKSALTTLDLHNLTERFPNLLVNRPEKVGSMRVVLLGSGISSAVKVESVGWKGSSLMELRVDVVPKAKRKIPEIRKAKAAAAAAAAVIESEQRLASAMKAKTRNEKAFLKANKMKEFSPVPA